MSIDQRAAFTLGIGYGAHAMAVLGLWPDAAQDIHPDLPFGKRDLRKKRRAELARQLRRRREAEFFLVAM